MSTTTRRRRRKPKYDEGDLQGPAKTFKAINGNSTRFGGGRIGWTFFTIALALLCLFSYYYDPSKHIFPRASQYELRHTAEETDAFKVADLPGRGKGMLAIRDIKQGERIITEKPAFIAPNTISGSPSAIIAKLLREASPKDREAVLNLSYVHFPVGLDPEKHPDEVVLAIFQTNAVATSRGVGIFPRMARLNHGCSSAFNAVYTWRDKEGVLVVHALKKITKGEEILTTYTDTKRPRAERRAYLKENYGFTCMCSVCSLPDIESRASDKRLTEISDGYARLATWGRGQISGVEAAEIVRTIWTIEDDEGYFSERGQLASDAAWIAGAHLDVTATSEWAALAFEWYGYELGSDSGKVEEMARIMGYPQSHREWGSREAQRIGGPAGR